MRLLVFCALILGSTGSRFTGRITHGVDSSARLEERRERSITEVPAVRGETPDGWLVPPIEDPATLHAPARKAASQEQSEDPNGSEIAEFVERFKNTKPPEIFQGDLRPGASHAVEPAAHWSLWPHRLRPMDRNLRAPESHHRGECVATRPRESVLPSAPTAADRT